MTPPTGDDRATSREAYRDFVRRHHPDVGGDPEVFLAGLSQFQSPLYRSSTMDESTVDTDGEGSSRFDAPVSFIPKTTRFGAAKQKLTRWREKKKQPPRVR